MHRIPVSVDRSKPVQSNLSTAPLLQSELPKTVSNVSNVAHPGFTGIPQVDRINQVSATAAADFQKSFPDPSEFLLNLNPAPSHGNSSLPPNIPAQQAPFASNEHSFQNVLPTSSTPIHMFIPTTETVRSEAPVLLYLIFKTILMLPDTARCFSKRRWWQYSCSASLIQLSTELLSITDGSID